MLSDDEIRNIAKGNGIWHIRGTTFARWKDSIDVDYPVIEVIEFARAVEREAYKRAAAECRAIAVDFRRTGNQCTYAWKADSAEDCAEAIDDAMKEQK